MFTPMPSPIQKREVLNIKKKKKKLFKEVKFLKYVTQHCIVDNI